MAGRAGAHAGYHHGRPGYYRGQKTRWGGVPDGKDICHGFGERDPQLPVSAVRRRFLLCGSGTPAGPSVCGVMVYAKSKQAAADLSRQVREGMLQKEYHAILCGHMDPSQGTLEDWLVRDGRQNLSRVAKKGERGAKKALLRYETVPFGSFRGLDGWLQSVGADLSQLSLVRVELLTGRHHQIRVQFAHAGCPILGDTRYNPTYAGKKGGIQLGLCASRLSFVHPLTGQRLSFTW